VQAWYPRKQVRLTHGAAKRYARRGDSGGTVTFNFCSECGGTVYWEATLRPDQIAVAVGTFADPEFAKPELSGWERRKHPWISSIGEQNMEHFD
jgi:hypothetical protein